MNKLLSKQLKLPFLLTLVITSSAWATAQQAPQSKKTKCPDFLNYIYPVLHSNKTINLCTLYTGKPLLLVNTASHCGYTHQFKGLEALYKKYKSQGVEVVGFASDDFKQAAKSEREAATICYKNYGVTFTMLAPTQVKGRNANQTFTHLNSKTREPKWNFNKYLITENGTKIEAYNSSIKPIDSKLESALAKALLQQKNSTE